MDVADSLEDQGYAVYTHYTSATALEWLERNPAPAIAVVDVELLDGTCEKVVRELTKRGVPFVVHSAITEARELAEFKAGTWLSKPSTSDALRDAVCRAML